MLKERKWLFNDSLNKCIYRYMVSDMVHGKCIQEMDDVLLKVNQYYGTFYYWPVYKLTAEISFQKLFSPFIAYYM